MSRTPLAVLALITLNLAACSWVDGVFRELSFETDITDDGITCLTNALRSAGHEAQYVVTNKTINYKMTEPDLGHVYYAEFRLGGSYDNDLNFTRDPKKLFHGARFGGSEPNKCEDVKPAAPLLVAIEEKVLPICGLALSKKPRQKIKCSK